jgi:ELWxxDGT repeat protein
MPTKRTLSAALALLLIAAIPARANGVPTWTLVDRIPGSAGSYTYSAAALGDYLYFSSSDDGMNNYELWRTDGTALGTTLVKDIRAGSDGSYPYNFTPLNGYLYFSADDGTNGVELWRTDGTADGTTLVKDIRAGSDDSYAYYFTPLGDYLYFKAEDATNGEELWRTDGTADGTTLVKDIRAGSNGSYPYNFTPLNGYLYFSADDGTNGGELWRTDGTADGTTLVKDIYAGSIGSYPGEMEAFGSYIYFNAYDGGSYELWRTDGTDAGTTIFHDFGSGFNYVYGMTKVGSTLYGSNGGYTWSTDGTTVTIASSFTPEAYGFTSIGNYVYYRAYSNISNNYKVYRLAEGGTAEEIPFPADYTFSCGMCYPTSFWILGDKVFTAVYGANVGQELAYITETTLTPTPSPSPTSSPEPSPSPSPTSSPEPSESPDTGGEELASTNRDAAPWWMTLLLLASVMAAAGIRLRQRESRRK